MAFTTLATIVGIAGIGLQMAGAAQQAKAQRMQLEAQADQQRAQAEIAKKQEHNELVNAEVAKLNAKEVGKAAEVAIGEKGLAVRQTVATARAALAENGVVVDQRGTTSEALVDDLIAAGAVDVTRILQRSKAEQVRALQQAQNFEMQADIFDTHALALRDVARHTDQQAGMISPGLAALTAGFGAAGNLLF